MSDEIAFYADNYRLIEPFDRENLKPAAYELTVGNEYFLHGEFLSLDENESGNGITIPPFAVAVIKTAEIVCLPRYLIARWNIKVRHAYAGLLWIGGPQVDPGWVGQLSCPIYNLSDKAVTLRLGDAIAVIDFVKTTPFNPAKNSSELKRYPFPPNRLLLEDYSIDDLESALFTKAGVKLVEFEQQISEFGTRFATFTQISFAVFALIIAASLTSRVGAKDISFEVALTGAGTLALAVWATLVAFFSYTHWRVGHLVYEYYGSLVGTKAQRISQFLRRAWWIGIVASVIVACVAGVFVYRSTDPVLQDIRKRDTSVSTEFRELTARVDSLEHTPHATLQDLEKLKANVELELQNAKVNSNRGQ